LACGDFNTSRAGETEIPLTEHHPSGKRSTNKMSMIDPKGSSPSGHANFLKLLHGGNLNAVGPEALDDAKKRQSSKKDLVAPDIDAA
jgi:hypothetical protein